MAAATAAERAQRHRDRKRRRVVAVPVEVGADVIAALQWKEYLDLDASDNVCNVTDKRALAGAIQAALGDLAEGAYQEYLAGEEAGEAPAGVPASGGRHCYRTGGMGKLLSRNHIGELYGRVPARTFNLVQFCGRSHEPKRLNYLT